jgi:hypothetical protein
MPCFLIALYYQRHLSKPTSMVILVTKVIMAAEDTKELAPGISSTVITERVLIVVAQTTMLLLELSIHAIEPYCLVSAFLLAISVVGVGWTYA